jgi:serine/threonine protein kinase
VRSNPDELTLAYERLKGLLPAQLDEIMIRAGAPHEHFGTNVPPAQCASSLFRWAGQSDDNRRALLRAMDQSGSGARPLEHIYGDQGLGELEGQRAQALARGADADGIDDDIKDIVRAHLTSEVNATRLGNYRLVEEIGHGTFSVVWRGRDLKSSEVVAIKMIEKRHARDLEVQQRFYNGCEALRALDGTGAVHLREGPVHEGDITYCVMDFVPGYDLGKWLAKDPALLRNNAVAIIEKIARTIEEAHGQGIIHRDLSPRNVLITPELDVRVTDFDMAKGPAFTAATGTGALGTAFCSAPEVMEHPNLVTKAADVYSLGVLSICLFLGVPPTTALLRQPHRVLRAGPFSEALRQLLFAAVQYDPLQRPADAQEFMRHFRRAMEAPPPGKGKRSDGSPLLAFVHDAMLIPVFHDGQRYPTRDDARHQLKLFRSKYQIPREDLGETDELLIWVQGYKVEPDEQRRGLVGNFARLTVTEEADGRFVVSVKKEFRDRHPIRDYRATGKGRVQPNWGHPILRKIVSGRSYPNERLAMDDLRALADEYPRVARPNWQRRLLGIIVWEPIDRLSGDVRLNPTRQYLFEVVGHPAGVTIACTPREGRPPKDGGGGSPDKPEAGDVRSGARAAIEQLVRRIRVAVTAASEGLKDRLQDELTRECTEDDARRLADTDGDVRDLIHKRNTAKALLGAAAPGARPAIALFVMDPWGNWKLRNVWARCAACSGLGYQGSVLCLHCGSQGWSTEAWSRLDAS